MKRVFQEAASRRKKWLASFTLIELLTVIAIIAILLAIVLYAAGPVETRGKRARAVSEIQAMSTALESYKTDNGSYPTASGLLTNGPSAYTAFDGTSTNYQASSQIVYQALSGQTNLLDTPVAGAKVYMSFKANQLGNVSAPGGTTGSGSTYVHDPWGYSYAYSTGTTNGASSPSYPYNGSGFFDLWSTGGITGTTATNVNAWVSNWTQ